MFIPARRTLGVCLIASLLSLAAGTPLRASSPGLDLVYSTYLGGSGNEWLLPGLVVDPAGRAWIAGSTDSTDYPVVAGRPHETDWYDYAITDGVASLLDPEGRLVRSSYLDGLPFAGEEAYGLALGPDGTAWIAGLIRGDGDVHALLQSFPGEGTGSGGSEIYAGEEADFALAVTTDAAGRIYMTGYTGSRWFHWPSYRMDQGRAWVMVLDGFAVQDVFFLPAGAGHPRAITVDAAGNIYVVGTAWDGFYTSPGAAQPGFAGGIWDAFVWKLDPAGATLWSTFLGGGLLEDASSVLVDSTGQVWVGGWTDSPDFPARGPALPSGAGRDGFLARLSPDGALLGSTRLGGTGTDGVDALAFDDRRGVLYLGGATGSPDFPLAAEPGEDWDAFVAVLDPAAFRLTSALRLGGSGYEGGIRLALGPEGRALHVAGLTVSSDFPTVAAAQPALAGGLDLFLAKIALNHPPGCSAASASPATLWPPDGRMVPVSIGGVADPDGDPVKIRVAAIHQDEPLSKKGTPDATGLGTATPMLRADRAGSGDGRVYHIAFEATDPAGASCTGTVAVCVPHDRGRPVCGDGGPLVDSTGTP